MVIYQQSYKQPIGASELEQEIAKLTVQDGFKITILELGFLMPDDGKIDGYVDDVRLDELLGEAYPSMDERAVVNRELVAGQFYQFKATSVTAGDFAVLVIYDKVKV